MKEQHTASTLLTCAGALMALSGVLMALCAFLAYGGILWAAAACLFFAARHFKLEEDRREDGQAEQEDTEP